MIFVFVVVLLFDMFFFLESISSLRDYLIRGKKTVLYELGAKITERNTFVVTLLHYVQRYHSTTDSVHV